LMLNWRIYVPKTSLTGASYNLNDYNPRAGTFPLLIVAGGIYVPGHPRQISGSV
jgi:hypothetical protein